MSVKLEDLKLQINQDIETIEWEGQTIEIKQYLPIQDKLNLINNIILESIAGADDFYTPSKIYVYMIVEIILAYTNIELIDLEKEDVALVYDSFVSSGLSAKIFEHINPYEYQQLRQWIEETIIGYFTYRNSALGVMTTIRDDYSQTDMDVEELRKKIIDNPEDFQFLRDVMDKLG